MTVNDRLILQDRMRYTKNKLSACLVYLAILFDVLYYVSIYKVLEANVGTFYYNYKIGLSIVYNLIFLLVAFLSSESVKSRKSTFVPVLLLLGIMQIVRIFYIPMQAHSATFMKTVAETGETFDKCVMEDGQFIRVIIYLCISAACCIAAAVTAFLQNQSLASYQRSTQKHPVER